MTMNRFNKYGDDKDGRNVMEFENSDLTVDELWTKVSAANEGGEDDIEELALAEIERRKKEMLAERDRKTLDNLKRAMRGQRWQS
jgi:hypothetical protein